MRVAKNNEQQRTGRQRTERKRIGRTRAGRRRGVVLLIVLSLLMLFAVMTVTFVVISGQFRSGANSYLRQRRGDDEPRRQSDRIVYTLLRDTNDFTNVMRNHSLLRDMYGDDGLRGRIAVGGGAPLPAALVNGEILELPVQVTVGSAEDINGYYNGCVFTIITGRARGTSLRIVGYRFDPGGGVNFPIFRVLVPTGDYAPPNLVGLLTSDLTSNVPVEVIINGRPFSGEGFGLYSSDSDPNPATNLNPSPNPLTGNLTYQGTWKLDRPHPGPDNAWGRAGIDDNNDGLMDDPNEWLWPGSDDSWSCMFPNHTMLPNNDKRVRGYAQGGGDEDYDSFDLQNMPLGAVFYEGPDYAIPIHVEPSFHRTALINFWFNWIDETWLKPLGVPDYSPTPAQPALASLERLGIFLQPFGPNNYPPGHPKNNPADEHAFFQSNPQHAWVLTQIARVKQMIMMRPTPEFHPDFTGSNERLRRAYSNLIASDAAGVYLRNPLVYGPFDVDNDFDGHPDSVWIDPGLPVFATPNGRVAKPMAAMLVLDMDGRFNLNAHGFPIAGPWPASTAPQNLAAGGSTLPTGFGFGPAEVDISKLFLSASSNPGIRNSANVQTMNLLFGNGLGRYGFDGVPGAPGIEPIASLKFAGFPRHYFQPNSYHVNYETPPDLWGEIQSGLDVRGAPTYTTPNTGRNLVMDHPYELDFSAKISSGAAAARSRDRMYDVGELEQLLRRNELTSGDVASGSGTQGRLSQLVQIFSDLRTGGPTTVNQANANRTMVTTHSFDVPVPNLPRTADWPLGRRPRHISEIIKERIRSRFNQAQGFSHRLTVAGAMPAPPFNFFGVPYNDAAHDPLIALQLARSSNSSIRDWSLVSTDLLMGLRMDVNRPFGNGRDDNGNGVIDEHWQMMNNFLYNEAYKGNANDERVYLATDLAGSPSGPPTDPDNDGQIALDTDAFLVRQIMARHLYVLMMAIKPHNYHFRKQPGEAGYNEIAERREDARILAQWAINAVDFRDPDSIMTPFEYDIDPFEPHPGPDGRWGVAMFDDDGDGVQDNVQEALYRGSDDLLWSVDGLIDDGTGTISADDDPAVNPRRGLVWGCERPDALLTETFAWHDVKQEDTSVNGLLYTPGEEDGDQPGVDDLDQRLRPQGGAMIELYNPWAGRQDRVAAELYANGSLMLNKVVVVGGTASDPVWRMVVTRQDPALPEMNNLDTQPQSATGATSYEHATDVVYFVDPSAPAPPAVTNSTDGSAATIHRPGVAIANLPPGRHALVGTYRFGPYDAVDPNTGSTDGTPDEYAVAIGHDKDQATGMLHPVDRSRRIVFHPNQDASLNWAAVELNSNSNAVVAGNNVQPPPVRLWPEPNPPYPSRPNNYGPATIQPTIAIPIQNFNLSESSAYPAVDAMGLPPVTQANGDVIYTNGYDIPFDDDISPFKHPNPQDAAKLQTNGTHPNFRRVHLQRLANPLLPHNKFTNPYMTIDSMPVDLHVFNGASQTGTTFDRTTPPDALTRKFDNEPSFVSRERGTTAANKSFWAQVDNVYAATGNVVTETNHAFLFNKDLRHSLGYLNTTYSSIRLQWDYSTTMPNTTTAPDKGYVGAGAGFVSPWLAWNNRPFISQYEMMLVPKTSSMNLLREFSTREEVKTGTSTPLSPYYPQEGDDTIAKGGIGGDREVANRGPYHHLLNFFATTYQYPTGGGLAGQLGPDMYLLFDLTGVPSPFVGTETWLNGTTFSGTAAGTELLHPPFNRIPNFREPGRVNFNTILNTATDRTDSGASALINETHQIWNKSLWSAILGNDHALPSTIHDLSPTTNTADDATSAEDRIVRSRRGGNAFMSTRSGRMNLAPGLPALFGNPLRSGDGGSLVPITARSALLLGSRPVTSSLIGLNMERPAVEVSLLRSERMIANTIPPDENTASDDNQYPPLLAELNVEDKRNTEENPQFRYRQLTRLPNLVTTRSNVYAVWVTIGYFEVDPQTGQLGQEIGTDSGKVERHRSFYILDRTIPVGFEIGKDHNVERAILLRRYIQ